MKHLTIIVPDGQTNLSSIACIVGTYEIFERANAYWYENHFEERFRIVLAGVSKKTDFHQGLLTVNTHCHVDDIAHTNLIVIPSLARNYEQALKKNKQLVSWIERQYKGGAEIASMCSGAYMLASAGLLDGKKCSTHWCFSDSFKVQYPKVNLQPAQLITHEHGIYTNGGGYSFLNLALYLVEKFYDRQTAIYCSKMFQIELDRQTQSPFIIFKGQKEHSDEIIKLAQAYIEDNLQEKISIEDLSSRFAVGRRNFDRRFIKATGNTPVEYFQRVKIEAAKKAFETSRKNINEVMYEVGYSDIKAFREVFRKITGMSPLEYRNKYNREAVI